MSLLEQSCFHCGNRCDDTISFQWQDQPHYFCCYGCQAISSAICAEGLGDFYRHRESLNTKAVEVQQDLSAYDLPDVQSEFVSDTPEGLREAHLIINGITCAACVWLIEKHINKLGGVTQVRVNASSHRATLVYDAHKIKLSGLLSALKQIGYRAEPLIQHRLEQHWQHSQRQQLMRLGVAGIAMMQSGMVALALHAGAIQGMEPVWVQMLRWVNLMFTIPVIFYSAKPFFLAAWRSLRAKHLVMDVSVSAALILAFIASVYATVTVSGEVYFDSIAMFTFFLLLGRFLEQRARWRNNQFNAGLKQLLPLTVKRVKRGSKDSTETTEFTESTEITESMESMESTETIPIRSANIGDHLRVEPGEVFPVDGMVISGFSEADESLLTGEALPQSKSPGDPVWAGSYNGGTQLEISVAAVAANTQLAAIEKLVANAEQHRPRQALLADRIAGGFVAAVLIISASVFTIWWYLDAQKALWVALSVLVVTCPCALSLATPTALTVAVNRLRKQGVLISSGETLESLTAVNTVVVDKTGTLSSGNIRIKDVLLLTPAEGDSQAAKQNVLQISAALEGASSHPIARAFAGIEHSQQAVDRSVKVGAGVSGVLDAVEYRLGAPSFACPNNPPAYPSEGLWLLLAAAQKPLAWIGLEDELRPSAKYAVRQLLDQKLRLVLLSGDRPNNVSIVAGELAIPEWQGGMLPTDKLDYVKKLQASGARVLMLGDGLNDLPVISGANVSCAMGSATNLTRTKASAVLLNDDLTQVPKAMLTAKRTSKTIKQNFLWAIVYNITALPLAVCGMVPPWLAAVGMSASSLIVVLNALRLAR